MRHLLTIGAIALLTFMLLMPQLVNDSLLTVLWSSAVEYQVVRVVLIALLFGLLFTTPPRSMRFRVALGVVSVVLLFGSAAMLLGYQMKILDAVIFLEIAIICGIEALESPAPLRLSSKKERAVART